MTHSTTSVAPSTSQATTYCFVLLVVEKQVTQVQQLKLCFLFNSQKMALVLLFPQEKKRGVADLLLFFLQREAERHHCSGDTRVARRATFVFIHHV